MKKFEVYKHLFENQGNQDIILQIMNKLSSLNMIDDVSSDVISLIEKLTLKKEDPKKLFIENTKNKQFIKSLKQDNKIVKLKGLSSFLTHLIIENEQSERKIDYILTESQIKNLSSVITDYVMKKEIEDSKVNDVVNTILKIYEGV